METRAKKNDPRIAGGAVEKPADIGYEVQPKDLIVGREYYFISNPGAKISDPTNNLALAPHEYVRAIYMGPRPESIDTALMLKPFGSKTYPRINPRPIYKNKRDPSVAIFYDILVPMTADERTAAENSLSPYLPSNMTSKIISMANSGSRKGSGGRRRTRFFTKRAVRRKSRR